MARGRGGFRAPKNYDPRRGQKTGARGAEPGGSRARGNAKPDPLTLKAPAVPKRMPDLEGMEKVTSGEALRADFAALGLGENLVRKLEELNVKDPFAVQVAAIPAVIAGKDVVAKAPTGSGKTIAFGAGVIERILRLKKAGVFGAPEPKAKPERGKRVIAAKGRAPKALILAPTRELALQIDETVQPLARSVGLYTAQVVGGMSRDSQVHALERGVDIVIGTPGRVEDLVRYRQLDLRQVQIAVVDEADHMSEMGFIEPVQRILGAIKTLQQTLLFSATIDSSVRVLVAQFMKDYRAFEIEASQGEIRHAVFVVLREEKARVLEELARGTGRAIFFVRTRVFAELLTAQLLSAGIAATELHGDLSQAQRNRSLERFHSGKARILVATDVAARGIHVDFVDLVVQADPTDDPKTYMHRSGRTGRAGGSGAGIAVSVVYRTSQKRARELLAEAGVEPQFFGYVSPGEVSKLISKLSAV